MTSPNDQDVQVQALLAGIVFIASVVGKRKVAKKAMRMAKTLRRVALPAELALQSAHVAVTAASG